MLLLVLLGFVALAHCEESNCCQELEAARSGQAGLPSCPPPYRLQEGRVQGAGSLDGWLRVFSKEQCADLCDSLPACSSFEYLAGSSEGRGRQAGVCHLNWQAVTDSPTSGSLVCSKASRLAPLTVSKDGGDFWLGRGETAAILTPLFTFWAHAERQEGTEEYTVSFRQNPVSLRIDQGQLSDIQKTVGWRRMLSFWAFPRRQPGLSPVSVTVGEGGAAGLSRGGQDSGPRSFLFWAFLPPHRSTHYCNVHIVLDQPLLQHFGSDVSVRVRDVFDRLNKIYSGSVFSQYGVVFQVSSVVASRSHCSDSGCSDVERLLEWFTEQEAGTEACLKYLFTYREFEGGTTGLGWKGGVCARKMKSRRLAPRNTGVVTFLNNNQTRSLQEVARTLAHEVGHNFGANHEEDTECEEPGSPGRLMAAVEEQGAAAEKLSNCAQQCIRENLRASLASDRARVDRCPSTVELLWGGWREDCFSPHSL